jgi:hypothetical protein
MLGEVNEVGVTMNKHSLEDLPEKIRIFDRKEEDYRNWLEPRVYDELVSRLSKADEPKTWPDLVHDFPGSWLPGRESSLARAMEKLAKCGALVITRTNHRNAAGFTWEESRYSINALHRMAAI